MFTAKTQSSQRFFSFLLLAETPKSKNQPAAKPLRSFSLPVSPRQGEKYTLSLRPLRLCGEIPSSPMTPPALKTPGKKN
jgi:hypothetical protein